MLRIFGTDLEIRLRVKQVDRLAQGEESRFSLFQ